MAETIREISSVDQFIILAHQAGVDGVELVDIRPDSRTGELKSRYAVAGNIAKQAGMLESIIAGICGAVEEHPGMTDRQKKRLMGRRVREAIGNTIKKLNDRELALAR